MDCIFCDIVRETIPADVVYEDDTVMAFRDIHPMAPCHILVIPKQHIPSAAHIKNKHAKLIGQLFLVCTQLARDMGLEDGYRIVTNVGYDGGQTVEHLHFHLLGGKKLSVTLA